MKTTAPTGRQSRQSTSDTARLKKSRCEIEEPCRCRLSFTITAMLAGIPSRKLTATITPAAMYQGQRQEVRGDPELEQFWGREEEVLELPSTVIMEVEWWRKMMKKWWDFAEANWRDWVVSGCMPSLLLLWQPLTGFINPQSSGLWSLRVWEEGCPLPIRVTTKFTWHSLGPLKGYLDHIGWNFWFWLKCPYRCLMVYLYMC